MLSYRHSFHAGNHADVLKHTVQSLIIEALKEKDKPFLYLDTHAGAGRYQLSGEHAERTGEYLEGIARIWQQDDLPAELEPYIGVVEHFNRSGQLRYYPGSPLIARQLLLNAGYKFKDGRLLDKSGKPIEIEFLIHQDGLQRTLMPFVRNLKRLGIQVHIRQVDVPQYIERMRTKDFDMTTDAMPQSLSPGNEQAQFWGSASADQPGNYNYAGIKNTAIDAVVQQLIRAPDRASLVTRT